MDASLVMWLDFKNTQMKCLCGYQIWLVEITGEKAKITIEKPLLTL